MSEGPPSGRGLWTVPGLRSSGAPRVVSTLLGGLLVAFLVLPMLALALSTSLREIGAGLANPLFARALWLSLRTTATSLVICVTLGVPLAWWLATSRSRLVRLIEVLVQLPIVVPPAVIGVALLQAFGARGLLGPLLSSLGVQLPFTPAAVVLAQVVVSAPFFVQAAANAFREVELDLLIVARTLGASATAAFFRVAVPVALPGLAVGACLAWARALGEFGATLIFAGNMSGRTQTLPLAIFTALESNVSVAVVVSLALIAIGSVLLLALRWVPPALARRKS